MQSSASVTEQKDLHLFSLEQLIGYQFKNRITLTGSVKWNKLNAGEIFFGGSGTAGIYINKLGTVQINYEKIYLPGYNSKLMPVDMGKLSFYRAF